MSITLASLVARLEADVPAASGVPNAAQYRQAVIDAMADLSRRASVPRVAVLAIVAGTAAYALPSDFQRIIRLAAIGAIYPLASPPLNWDAPAWPGGGTLVTPQGLVPFSGSYREQITVAGNQLTIYPTPQASADRQLVYAAGDSLNDAGTAYDTVTEDRASIALLLAKATCLERIANSPSGGALKITTGGDTVDFGAQASATRSQASGLRSDYLAAIASLNAATGGLG